MDYVITANGKPDRFEDNVSAGDVVEYSFDFSPYLEGKGSITDTIWTVEMGNASLVDTDQSALITFTYAGTSIITCLITTSSGEKKKVWLLIRAKEYDEGITDYEC